MLNVMHLVNTASLWGPGRQIISLAGKLNNNKCRVILGYSVPGPMLDRAAEIGLETVQIPMWNPFDIKAAIELKRICRELSIDIVHTHFLRENYVSAISKLLGNRMVLVKTMHLLNEKNFLHRMSNFVFTAFDDTLIAVSEAARLHHGLDVMPGKQIQVIHDGIDPQSWSGRRNLKIRESLGIDRKAFVITSLSRFSEEKGHLFLMESIKRFHRLMQAQGQDLKQCVFLLAGDGELHNQIAELAKMLGIDQSIIFTGYRQDVREILHTTDLFISHSKSEGLGLSMLEALASGVPVLSTRSGGTSEILKESEGCGLLVDYGDTEEFAAALMRFITDKKFYKECKNCASEGLKEKFSLDYAAEETYNLYIRSLTAGNC